MGQAEALRLAVAQLELNREVPTAESLAAAGARVRDAIQAAARASARMIQFPEGTLAFPHKRLISRRAPELDESDWAKVDWTALRSELEDVARTARQAGIWVVVGAPHLLRAGRRPHNSLYVFSDKGALVTRYDKRRLSMTEITYMYTPGNDAVMFELDGFRVGMVICVETLFPDFFVDYADGGADLVLISSAGGGIFGQLAAGYAAINGITVALSIPPDTENRSLSGVCGPNGWLAQLPDGKPGMTIANVPKRSPDATFHFKARHGLYDAHLDPDEPRSLNRTEL